MKAKELIKIFEISTQILDHYKNKEIVDALTDILDMCKANSSQNLKKKTTTIRVDSEIEKNDKDLFLNEMTSFTLDEIQERLNDKSYYPNVESLRNLATSIGLSKQSRSNKENIIHSIIKVIERSRIDKTISERHDEI